MIFVIVDPKRWKIFLLPFMTFTQEQSQEEDVKDCTGQISKPVSQDLCRISIRSKKIASEVDLKS